MPISPIANDIKRIEIYDLFLFVAFHFVRAALFMCHFGLYSLLEYICVCGFRLRRTNKRYTEFSSSLPSFHLVSIVLRISNFFDSQPFNFTCVRRTFYSNGDSFMNDLKYYYTKQHKLCMFTVCHQFILMFMFMFILNLKHFNLSMFFSSSRFFSLSLRYYYYYLFDECCVYGCCIKCLNKKTARMHLFIHKCESYGHVWIIMFHLSEFQRASTRRTKMKSNEESERHTQKYNIKSTTVAVCVLWEIPVVIERWMRSY